MQRESRSLLASSLSIMYHFRGLRLEFREPAPEFAVSAKSLLTVESRKSFIEA